MSTTRRTGRPARLFAALALPLVLIGGAPAATAAPVPVTPSAVAPTTPCPMPTIPPAEVRGVTTTTATIHYYGVHSPQCGFGSGVPTLSVRLAGDAWDGITPPLRTVTGPDARGSGDLTVTDLKPGTAYEWRLSSSGRGIPPSRGTFTTSPVATPTTVRICPTVFIMPPALGEVTSTTAVITYNGVNMPECGLRAGTPTLRVYRPDQPDAPPVATLVGPEDVGRGSFTVTGLLPFTKYFWQLTSTGNITGGSGTFTTLTLGPPTSAPPTTPPPSACTASMVVASTWATGYQADFTITVGPEAIDGWTVVWPDPEPGKVWAWGATVTRDGTTATATAADWNRRAAAGSTVRFGFTGPGRPPATPPRVICTAGPSA